MPDITFRELCSPAELQIIRDIAADVWPKTFAAILSGTQIHYMMQMMYAPQVMEKELADGYHFLIINIDNIPSGYFSWSKTTSPGTAKLHKLYLMQKFHKQGIGSAMLAKAESEIGNAGFSRIRLNVNKHNLPAIKAYQRNGFTTVEKVKIDIGQGFYMDDFVMEKVICRPNCGACCIAPSITSAIPGMPDGKPAGTKCVNLDENMRCKIFFSPERPTVCASLKPSVEMCGNCREEAEKHLNELERMTQP